MKNLALMTFRRSTLLSVAVLVLYGLSARNASAVTIVNTTPVPNAIAQETMDLNTQSALAIQNGIGTLNYNSNPGCAAAGASCYATTTLNGPAGGPAVIVNINQNGTGGGNVNYAEIYYYVTYNGSGPVSIQMSDTLNATGSARAQAYFGLAPANLSFSGPLSPGLGYIGQDGSTNNNLPLLYNLTDCVGGCINGVGVNSGTPLGNINNVNMTSGLTYLVDIWVEVSPANSVASAELDPTFTAPNGSFIFSAGVQSAIPEPSTWAMMILGFVGLGFMAYRRKQNGFGL